MIGDLLLADWFAPVARFLIGSSLLLGGVALLEHVKLLQDHDLRRTSWRAATVGSLLLLLPMPTLMTHKVDTPLSALNPIAEPMNALRDTAVAYEKRMVASNGAQLSASQSSFDGFDSSFGGQNFQPLPTSQTTQKRSSRIQEKTKSDVSAAADIRPESDSETSLVAKERQADFTSGTTSAPANKKPVGENGLLAWFDTLLAAMPALDRAPLMLFALVALALAAHLLTSFFLAVRGIGTRQTLPKDHPATVALAVLSAKAGLKDTPTLSWSETLSSPLCLPGGEICLPFWMVDSAEHFEDPAMLDNVLAHELGHLVHRDPMMLIAMQVISRVLFFQPLFFLARKRLADLAELHADAWAARQTGDARGIAQALFDCATTINKHRQWGLAMTGNPTILKERVETLLSNRPGRSSWLARGTLTAVLLSVAAAAPALDISPQEPPEAPEAPIVPENVPENVPELVAPELVAPEPAQVPEVRGEYAPAPSPVPNPVQTHVPNPVAVHVADPTPAPVPDPTPEPIYVPDPTPEVPTPAPVHVADPGHDVRIRSGQHNDKQVTTFSTNDDKGNRVVVEMIGNFMLTDDLKGIKSMENGSEIDVLARLDGDKYRLYVEEEGRKPIVTVWNGSALVEKKKDKAKILAKVLEHLTLGSAVLADQVTDTLMKKGGAKAVLSFINKIPNDATHARWRYLAELSERAKLSSKQLKTVTKLALKTDSSHYKRMIGATLLKHQKDSKALTNAIFEIADSMDSDHEIRLMLSPVIKDSKLTDRHMKLLVAIADRMSSDHELRLLLSMAVKNNQMDSKTTEKLVAIAANTIKSDHEMRLLLTTLIRGQRTPTQPAIASALDGVSKLSSDHERRLLIGTIVSSPELSKANWLRAIKEGDRIGSDHEKRLTLSHIRKRMPDNDQIQQAWMKAVRGISSDNERRRLISALVSDDASEKTMAEAIDQAATIGSNHERRKLLTTILSKNNLTDDNWVKLLAVTEQIGSNQEKKKVLHYAQRRLPKSDKVRAAFLTAVETLSSERDREQLTQALDREKRRATSRADLYGQLSKSMPGQVDLNNLYLELEAGQAFAITGDKSDLFEDWVEKRADRLGLDKGKLEREVLRTEKLLRKLEKNAEKMARNGLSAEELALLAERAQKAFDDFKRRHPNLLKDRDIKLAPDGELYLLKAG